MPFLDEVLQATNAEIDVEKKNLNIGDLKRKIRDASPVQCFNSVLVDGFGIIAEIKKRSPSAGEMRAENVEQAPKAYSKSPIVKAVSFLTNGSHFGMSIHELEAVRPRISKPILRKDFIIKEYQVYQARAFGADAILLMANILSKSELKHLFSIAKSIGLEVLFEVHEKSEIEKLPEGAKVWGVNSRKFMADKRWWLTKQLVKWGITKSAKAPDPTVDLEIFSLIKRFPPGVTKVAESGVRPGKILQVKEMGFDASLIGTSILKHPGGVTDALMEFEKALKPAEQLVPSQISVAA